MRLCQLAADELTLQERSKIRQFSVFDNLLFYTPERGGASVARLCVPASYNNAIRLTVLFEAHEAYLHQGAEHTNVGMQGIYYWPTMISDIQRYVNSCQSCRRMKSWNHAETGALEGHSIPSERWDTLHLDFITDLQPTKEGFDTILVCADRLSRYTYLIPAKKVDTSLITARRLFQTVFSVHGPPGRLITDRDSRWLSSFFQELMGIMNVKQTMGTSHHHDFNRLVENVNRTAGGSDVASRFDGLPST